MSLALPSHYLSSLRLSLSLSLSVCVCVCLSLTLFPLSLPPSLLNLKHYDRKGTCHSLQEDAAGRSGNGSVKKENLLLLTGFLSLSFSFPTFFSTLPPHRSIRLPSPLSLLSPIQLALIPFLNLLLLHIILQSLIKRAFPGQPYSPYVQSMRCRINGWLLGNFYNAVLN